jgi:hypothetical protein
MADADMTPAEISAAAQRIKNQTDEIMRRTENQRAKDQKDAAESAARADEQASQ